MINRWHSLWLAVLLFVAVPAFAQEPPAEAAAPAAPVAWSSLSPEQQKVLGNNASQWNSLPAARQQALAHGSQRYLSMSSEQRGQAQERFTRWRALPPEQRQALRQRWQRFQALSPTERDSVRDSFHRFQQLPPERRQMLREQWQRATPAQRQQMVQSAREKRAHRAPPMPHAPPPHR